MQLKKTILSISIAIVFTVFIAYGLFAIYEPPKYYYEPSDCFEQFDCEQPMRECSEKLMHEQEDKINRADNTSAANQDIIEPRADTAYDDCWRKNQASPEYIDCMKSLDDCEDEFRKTTERYRHARNSFFILFIIASAAIIGGLMLRVESISSGFLGGGVLILLWSLIYTATFWLEWNKYVKIAALGFILGILVYLGYRRTEMRGIKRRRSRTG